MLQVKKDNAIVANNDTKSVKRTYNDHNKHFLLMFIWVTRCEGFEHQS